MHTLYRFAAVLFALLLLAGCAGSAGVSSSSAASSPQTSPAPASAPEDSLPEGALEAMEELVRLYEIYCQGRTLNDGLFIDGRAVYPTESLAFGYLLEKGMLDVYKNPETDCWDVPYVLLDGVNRLFFERVEPFYESELDEIAFFADVPEGRSLPYTLSAGRDLRLERDRDNTVSLTFHRQLEGQVLKPVTYRFAPHQVNEIPPELAEIFSPGDIIYQITSVTQRPDLLPAHTANIIEISTPGELLAAAERINAGDFANIHDTYRLTADIDLAGIEWIPMGRNLPPLMYEDERDPNPSGFNGTFDGQGHTIRNLTIPEDQGRTLMEWMAKNSYERNGHGIGLFFAIGEDGVVQDLTLENASVLMPLEWPEEGMCSAGIVSAFCRGELRNVSVQGEIQGTDSVGGLVGTLTGSQLVGPLSGPHFSGPAATGIITGCTADVKVTGHSAAGGLVGALHFGTLRNSTAYGVVTAAPIDSPFVEPTPMAFGGVAGHSVEGIVDNCHGGAEIRTLISSRCVGSFCGLAEGGGIYSSSVNAAVTAGWKTVGDYHRLEPEHPEVWLS